MSRSHVSFICLFALAGCDSPSTNPPDAAPQAIDARPTTIDAVAPDAPLPALALLGEWTARFQYGPTRDVFTLQLQADGAARIGRQRRDEFGTYINCTTLENLDATWSATATAFTLTPVAGTIERFDELGGLQCDNANIIIRREMTSPELMQRDFFSGPYVLSNLSFDVTSRSVVFAWRRP